MAEIADDIVDGLICQYCQQLVDGDAPGHPRTCPSCKADERRKPRQTSRTRTIPPAAAKQNEALPKWKLNADDDVVVRYHCASCTKHFSSDEAARDHVRAAHGGAA